MKYLALILMFFSAGDVPKDIYWICYQTGTLNTKSNSSNTLMLSALHVDSYDNYDDRERQFSQRIKEETNNRFVGQFEPKCAGFNSAKKAMKFRDNNSMRAKNNNYVVWNIDFKYDPKNK